MAKNSFKKSLVWMRRDLRLHDHRALHEALANSEEIYLTFNFDPAILKKLPENDRRVTFIMESLKEIEEQLQKKGSTLFITHGDPTEEIPKLIAKEKIEALFFNRDYEPYAKKRDQSVTDILQEKGIKVHNFKDSVVFEGDEIETKTGGPYKVFTPYKNAWYERFGAQERIVPDYKVTLKKLVEKENKNSITNKDWFKELGFTPMDNVIQGGTTQAKKKLKTFEKYIANYEEARDFPALDQTSHISSYIRHGNISIRDLFRLAFSGTTNGHRIWASELIWREFYQAILDQFPHVEKDAFKEDYKKIPWRGGAKEFNAWKNGQTGFPIVDAAMRCFKETGMMHNRLRMIVASFLCKTLLVDWKKGEQYFALTLMDFDLAANNGGWQWSSSTGTDAQPYFRIFNPTSQSEKFDPEGEFIKKWCPELAGFSKKIIHQPTKADMFQQAEANCTLGKDYPFPVVDYKLKRQEALEMYKEALGKA